MKEGEAMDYTVIKDKLRILIEDEGGVVSSKTLQEAGIQRYEIYSLLLEGYLIKESHGKYVLSENTPDEYKVIQCRSEKLIFSYATALYLHGMSDKVPRLLDITVPQGDNISRIKKLYPNIKFHYCKKELWDVGIQDIITPQGYTVKAYDLERCICDLIREKESVDVQVYPQAVREYFSGKKCNPRKIIKYSKLFNVEEMVRNYMEVLQ